MEGFGGGGHINITSGSGLGGAGDVHIVVGHGDGTVDGGAMILLLETPLRNAKWGLNAN